MIKFILALMVTVPASARLYDTDKQFIEHENLLENPGFVYGKAGWNITAGESFSVSGSGRDAAATWDATATAKSFCSDAVAVPARLKGKNGYFFINMEVDSGTATHKVYAYDGSSVLGGQVDVTTSTTPVSVSGNFVFPTSGNAQICIESQANEPSIDIYNAYLGDAANLTQVKPENTFSVRIDNTAGTPSISSGTETGGDWVTSLTDNGVGDVTVNFTSNFFTATPNCQVTGYIGTAHRFCYASRDTAISTSAVRVECANDGGASTDESFFLQCQKTGADDPIDAVKADNTNRPWTAYTPTFTGFGTAANVSCYWKRQGEDLLARCTFDAGTTTATEARVSIPYTSASTIDTVEIAGVAGWSDGVSQSLNTIREPSVAYITFGNQAGTGGAVAKFNASTYFSSGDTISFEARVPIEGWEETMNAPLIKQSVVTSSNGVYGDESAHVADGASTTTVSRESGDWITGNCTNPTTSNYVCTIESGIFSDTPNCEAEADNNTNGYDCKAYGETTTQVSIKCGTAGSSQDMDFKLFCHGPR